MKKIPTIFLRDPNNPDRLLDTTNPLCAWVFAGEGVATRKYDGTCVLIQGGNFYKRCTVRPDKPNPLGFIQVDYDPATGKAFGWALVTARDPSDRWHLEAWGQLLEVAGGPSSIPDGTYELCGPKVQGNPEELIEHTLIRHGEYVYPYSQFDFAFDGLRDWLRPLDIEGLVFHHADGRMGKIKKSDFGLARKVTA